MVETNFKQTEIGLIPEDWVIDSIGNSFIISNNLRQPVSEDIRATMQGIYPYYGPTKIQDYINTYRVEGEYALIGEDGDHFLKWRDVSMTQIASGRFNVNNHAHLLKGKVNVTTTKWFYYFYKHRDITPFLTRQGAGRYKLSKGTLVDLPCAIPPTIEEQQAIATALNDADTWIESLEKLIAKKRLIKQGAMQELFIPKEGWKIRKLGEISVIEKGIQFNSSNLSEKSLYPCYSGGIFPSGYSEQFNEEENSIIISEGGNSCGYVNFVRTKFWLGGHCYKINIAKKLDKIFMYYLLKNNQELLMDLRVGSGLPNIQKKSLIDFSLVFPSSIDEQVYIANILSDMDAEIDALEHKLQKARQIKKGMMQQLLTGKIRLIKNTAAQPKEIVTAS